MQSTEMALEPEQEQLEHDLRVELMTVNVAKLRADLAADQKRYRVSVWAIVLQGAGVAVAGFAAGAAWVAIFHPFAKLGGQP